MNAERVNELIEFANLMLSLRGGPCDTGDIDGGELLDAMASCGILVKVKVSEPCGSNCSCEFYADPGDFPLECYRAATDLVPIENP